MKKSELRGIIILIIVGILVIVTINIAGNKRRNEGQSGGQVAQGGQVQEEEYVKVLDDGTRLNTSAKLQEKKTLEGLEISNFQLTEKDNVTQFLGTIKNTSTTEQGGFLAELKILDKEGKEIQTTHAYIGTLQPGESSQLNTSGTFDYANAYDFTIDRVD